MRRSSSSITTGAVAKSMSATHIGITSRPRYFSHFAEAVSRLSIGRSKSNAPFAVMSLRAIRLLQRRDVELDHLQHRVARPPGAGPVLVGHHLFQDLGDDLPANPESIDQPSARLRLPSALEERVPVAIELLLVFAEDDQRDRVVEVVVGARRHCLEALAEERE